MVPHGCAEMHGYICRYPHRGKWRRMLTCYLRLEYMMVRGLLSWVGGTAQSVHVRFRLTGKALVGDGDRVQYTMERPMIYNVLFSLVR